MGIHFQKREKKSKTLKTYIFVKLFNQNEKIKQFEYVVVKHYEINTQHYQK
jgi:hypothetical protein